MLITMETDYAIRIMGYLIQDSNLATAAEISDATSVPLRFAKNILQKLSGKGLIVSRKGIHGGYKLSMQPADISLYDIYNAIQGPIVLNDCLKGVNRTCKADGKCFCHEIFMQLSQDIENKLSEIKFSSIVTAIDQ